MSYSDFPTQLAIQALKERDAPTFLSAMRDGADPRATDELGWSLSKILARKGEFDGAEVCSRTLADFGSFAGDSFFELRNDWVRGVSADAAHFGSESFLRTFAEATGGPPEDPRFAKAMLDEFCSGNSWNANVALLSVGASNLLSLGRQSIADNLERRRPSVDADDLFSFSDEIVSLAEAETLGERVATSRTRRTSRL